MDLKEYFRQLRNVEAALPDEYPFIVSSGKGGGKAGVISEVPRAVAAKMLVEGLASLATEAQIEDFRDRQEISRKAAEQAELAKQIQVAIVSGRQSAQDMFIRKNNGPLISGK